ncbi:MAG TPA: glycosyltransferase [Candidatus Gastranaerophilaceae bacterium]|nr:glycosyltransferase [Candidatus Gastranaerophilaceae bacterium]HPT41735.1 glycosyltransferase [Candidatus Gastranaerophilaceae bacterium]
MKISVIVPAYNTSSYLKQCLESLISQTFNDIEIICVNDGSTDNSLEILNKFAKKDKRIKIISQKNQGLSAARNTGIKAAKGEYIGFVDSDDWADESMFEKLYQNAKKFDADISMCSITTFNEDTGVYNNSDPYMTMNLFPESFEDRVFSPKETYDFIFRICVVAWNKIYKRDFLDKIGGFFKEGLVFEDNLFFCQTFMQANKICITKENLIFYRLNSPKSITFGDKDFQKLDFFEVFELIEKFLKEKNYYGQLEDYFQNYKKGTLVYWYKKLKNEDTKQKYLKKFKKLYPEESLILK